MNSSISKILADILQANSNITFYTFSNADSKTWIMPQKNMCTAMNLYQPSGIKGKWMKNYFPYLYWIKPLQKRLGIAVNQYELQLDIKKTICRIFHSDAVDFSIFCGTPSVHQKITIQISNENKILGYCKLSDKEDIKNLFLHEQKILGMLKEKEVSQIPECLYCNTLKDNLYLFIQSTTKTNHSKTLHNWNDLHWNFLTHLKEKTEQIIPFEQTDFFQSIKCLQQNQAYLLDSERAIIVIAIDKVLNHYKNSTVNFSVCQGDFTPWNMFMEKNQLFVFDWEYAGLTYPDYIDRFHFFTQCCIFEQHFDAKKIARSYLIQKQTFSEYITNPDFQYLCYLLDIISRYVNRDKGIYSEAMKNSLKIWIQLIFLLLKCEK